MLIAKLGVVDMGKDTMITFEGYIGSKQFIFTNEERENVFEDVFVDICCGAEIMGREKPDRYVANTDVNDESSELYMVVQNVPYYIVIGMIGVYNESNDNELYHISLFL